MSNTEKVQTLQTKLASFKYDVKARNYFARMVLGSKMTIEECFTEKIHNVFDNDGNSLDIKLFNKDHGIIKYDEEENALYLVMADNCPESMKNPIGIMESLREKESEEMNSGVGNFNFGEIAAIFNQSNGCIYLRSKVHGEESIGNKFTIKLGKEGTPEMINGLDEKEEGLLKKLDLNIPETGTVKIFILKGDKDINPKEIIKYITSITNMKITYNNHLIEGHNYIKDSEKVNPCHKFTEEIYRANLFVGSEGLHTFSKLKNNRSFFLHDEIKFNDNKLEVWVNKNLKNIYNQII